MRKDKKLLKFKMNNIYMETSNKLIKQFLDIVICATKFTINMNIRIKN